MKHFHFSWMMVLLLVLLCGCGDESSLTEEENDLIAHYAANQVLQHNPEYEERLATTEQASGDDAATTTQTPETATTQDVQTAETDTSAAVQTEATTENVSYVTDVSGLYENLNLNVIYAGYTIARQYTDKNTSSLAVEASDGKRLLIVKLDIKNTSRETLQVDMLNQNYQYSLHTDTDVVEPMLTMLDDDFTVYTGKLKAGASRKTVILFEIPKEAEKPLNYTLEVSNGTSSNMIAIP